MAQVRLGATATLDLTPLTTLVTQLAPDRVEANYFLAGNLKLLLPDADIQATGTTDVRGDKPQRLLLLDKLPPGVTELRGGVLDLAYAATLRKPLRVEWHMLAPPG